MKKGPENRKNEETLRPRLCRPLKRSMIQSEPLCVDNSPLTDNFWLNSSH